MGHAPTVLSEGPSRYADEASIRQDRIKVSFYEIGCSPLSWTLSPSADLLFRAQIVDPVEN